MADEERTRLITTNTKKWKKYLCTTCGEKKEADLFYQLDRVPVNGEFGCVYVPRGTGICKECEKAKREKDAIAYAERMKEYKRKWYQDHKEEIAERQKQNRKKKNEQNRKYTKSHREQINEYVSKRKQIDPMYKLKCQARKTVYMSFARTGNVKPERCEQIVGLTPDDFASYLYETYKQTYGKEWDGVEKVHIDHIIPLATAKTEEDVLRLCHYTNLRLITAEDNLLKGAKLDYSI